MGKGYFGSVAELLEDCRASATEGRYRHIDLMQEYLNSFRGALYYKDSISTIIRGFYKKNRAELPREKVTCDGRMLIPPRPGRRFRFGCAMGGVSWGGRRTRPQLNS